MCVAFTGDLAELFIIAFIINANYIPTLLTNRKWKTSIFFYLSASFLMTLLPPPRRFCFHPCPFVCCAVGLSAKLQKNYWTDFHETWKEDETWPRINSINFWCRSRWERKGPEMLSHSLTLRFSTFFFNFSGNNLWILMKKIWKKSILQPGIPKVILLPNYWSLRIQ